jgi:hypothetical protein
MQIKPDGMKDLLGLSGEVLKECTSKRDEMARELYNGDIPLEIAHVWHIAWREALLYACEKMRDHAVFSHHNITQGATMHDILENIYTELTEENNLSPYHEGENK